MCHRAAAVKPADRRDAQGELPVPGDLAFFGFSASSTEHVGIYIGNGKMIDSHETGIVVPTDTITQGGNLIGCYQY